MMHEHDGASDDSFVLGHSVNRMTFVNQVPIDGDESFGTPLRIERVWKAAQVKEYHC